MSYSLGSVAETYEKLGPFDYSNLLKEGLVDKQVPRVMYTTCVMVDGSRYTGQFKKYKHNVKDGIGHIIYPDGSLFEGVFKDDDTVKGRYIFTNGCIYEGEMKNHKMHGKGVLKGQDQPIYEGEFFNGEQCDKRANLVTSASNLTPLLGSNQKRKQRKSVKFTIVV